MRQIVRLLPEGGHRPSLLHRLGSLAALSAAEENLLYDICSVREAIRPAGSELLHEGQTGIRPLVILSGWACRMRILADGRRQIMCLLLPGDLVGFAALRPSMAAHATVAAITNVELADAETLCNALESSEPGAWNGLKDACRAAARLDECALLDQIVRLGRKTAYERVADFLLELHWRLRLAGLVKGEDFEMPLTQEQIADMLGLSNVHVNRTLQQLRRDGLLELGGGRARLLERQLLEEYTDFRAPLENL